MRRCLALLQAGRVPGVSVLVGADCWPAWTSSRRSVTGLFREYGCCSRYVIFPCAMAALTGGRRRSSSLVWQCCWCSARWCRSGRSSIASRVPAARQRVGPGAHHRRDRDAPRAACLGPVFFGGEGLRSVAFGRAFHAGADQASAQSLLVIAASVAVMPAVAVLRPLYLRQGVARHRREPRRRAPGRHPHRARRLAELLPRRVDRHAVGHPDRADHHHLLRHRLPHRPEGLRRRDPRRHGELSARRGRLDLPRAARVLRLVLRAFRKPSSSW